MAFDLTRDTERSAAAGSYVRLPPGRGYLLAPSDSRASLLPSLSMVTSGTVKSRAIQRSAHLAVRVVGPAALASLRAPWQPPLPAEDWYAALATWQQRLGPVDHWAVYQAPQSSRQGCTVMGLREGRGRWIVKTGRHSDGRRPALEAGVLSRIQLGEFPSVRVPRLLAEGEIMVEGEPWVWFAQELLSTRLHAPAVRVALADLERDIRRSLSDWLPKPAGTPDHWVPIHGDLTPWNLRRTTYSRGPDSRPFLIDWESTRWGPPGADTVYLWLSSAASDIRSSARAARRQVLELSRDSREESRTFWFEIIAARSRDDEDGDVSRRMLALLEPPARSAGPVSSSARA